MKYKKVLLSIWGDCKGAMYLELVPPNATINAHVYCQQLERLNKALKKKRLVLGNQKGLMFHKNNARPYTAKITSQKIEVLGWEKIFHLSFLLTLLLSKYRFSCSLQNRLQEINF